MPDSRRFPWTSVSKPIIGMLHAPPLPGSPKYAGNWPAIITAVLQDAQILSDGGVHALLLENFGDAPFFPKRVPAHTVTHMSRLAEEVRRNFGLPLGINVLRNDGQSALAIAAAVEAAFIRVNVLSSARVTDQGVIEGIAHDLLRERALLGTSDIQILADVNVKHSAPLAQRPLADEVADCIQRGGADAVVASGPATGQPTDVADIRTVRQAAGGVPVLVGSGVTSQSLADQLPLADGFIVGSSLKKDGVATNPVDPARVACLMRTYAGGAE